MSTTTEHMSVTDTAKLIRKALKAAHPGVKFSVRSSSYAGGASIDVRWTDGPTAQEVDRTAKLYEGSTFDGMTDSKSYHSTLLADEDGTVRDVHFGADHVFTHRELSDEHLARVTERVRAERRMLSGYYGRCAGNRRDCTGMIRDGQDCWYVEDHPEAACSPECAAQMLARMGAA